MAQPEGVQVTTKKSTGPPPDNSRVVHVPYKDARRGTECPLIALWLLHAQQSTLQTPPLYPRRSSGAACPLTRLHRGDHLRGPAVPLPEVGQSLEAQERQVSGLRGGRGATQRGRRHAALEPGQASCTGWRLWRRSWRGSGRGRATRDEQAAPAAECKPVLICGGGRALQSVTIHAARCTPANEKP